VIPALLAILTIMATLGLTAFQAPTALATTPTYTLTAIPDQAAYYYNATPVLSVTLEYKDSPAITVKMNIAEYEHDLETGISISGTGTYTASYNLWLDGDSDNVNDYTNATGTKAFTLRVIETTNGFVLAQATFVINVQTESVMIAVAWEDQNGDRRIDVNEPVILHIQIVWAFLDKSESANIYVGDTLVGTVSLTAGQGQTTTTHMVTFDTAGTHTLLIKLVNTSGEELASTILTLSVIDTTHGQSGFYRILSTEGILLIMLAVVVVLLIVIAVRR